MPSEEQIVFFNKSNIFLFEIIFCAHREFIGSAVEFQREILRYKEGSKQIRRDEHRCTKSVQLYSKKKNDEGQLLD